MNITQLICSTSVVALISGCASNQHESREWHNDKHTAILITTETEAFYMQSSAIPGDRSILTAKGTVDGNKVTMKIGTAVINEETLTFTNIEGKDFILKKHR